MVYDVQKLSLIFFLQIPPVDPHFAFMADDPAIISDMPTRSRASSDVYKASFGGKCVAVKVFRETVSKYEMKRVEKVFRDSLVQFSSPLRHVAAA